MVSIGGANELFDHSASARWDSRPINTAPVGLGAGEDATPGGWRRRRGIRWLPSIAK
jgi:hypothetical protein